MLNGDILYEQGSTRLPCSWVTGTFSSAIGRDFAEMNSVLLQYADFGEGTGTPLQYSCLENPMDGRAWWAAIYGVTRVGHN